MANAPWFSHWLPAECVNGSLADKNLRGYIINYISVEQKCEICPRLVHYIERDVNPLNHGLWPSSFSDRCLGPWWRTCIQGEMFWQHCHHWLELSKQKIHDALLSVEQVERTYAWPPSHALGLLFLPNLADPYYVFSWFRNFLREVLDYLIWQVSRQQTVSIIFTFSKLRVYWIDYR